VRERAAEAQRQRPPPLTQIVVRSVGALERVPVADLIRWLASAGNYVELHLRMGGACSTAPR
jgi:hypothetical protein